MSHRSDGADEQFRPFVACRGLTKRFGSTQALNGIDLDIRTDQIHGLVGQNGAGKSTLLGILTGRIRPTSGSIEVNGVASEERGLSVRNASRHGISAVYQELTLVPALSAIENVFLGRELTQAGVLSIQRMRRRFDELCEELEIRIPKHVPVRQLPIAQQQLVEILRGLNSDAKVLLLDEPTAALPEHERMAVLQTMRRLRDRGVGLLFITHALDEVLEVADTITVLRAGASVGSRPSSAWAKKSLIHAMSGKYEEFQPKLGTRVSMPPFLRVEGLKLPGALQDVDLELRPGEIVGLAGLVGSGRTSIMRCLAGAEPRSTGRMWLDGQERPWPRTVSQGLRQGIALLPEDRKSHGLHMTRSILDNLTLMNMDDVSTAHVIRGSRQRMIMRTLAGKLGLPNYPPSTAVGKLSGGNQQKVLLGKVLHARPRLLLADEPTRGVDITAKIDIMRSLRDLAAEGMAILMTTSEIEDVLNVADSVLVVAEGKVVAHLDTHDRSVSVSDILHIAFNSTTSTSDSPPSTEGDVA